MKSRVDKNVCSMNEIQIAIFSSSLTIPRYRAYNVAKYHFLVLCRAANKHFTAPFCMLRIEIEICKPGCDISLRIKSFDSRCAYPGALADS